MITVISLRGEKLMAKIMTTRPPEELHKQLKYRANKKGLTLNALVIQILWEWIEREKGREK